MKLRLTIVLTILAVAGPAQPRHTTRQGKMGSRRPVTPIPPETLRMFAAEQEVPFMKWLAGQGVDRDVREVSTEVSIWLQMLFKFWATLFKQTSMPFINSFLAPLMKQGLGPLATHYLAPMASEIIAPMMGGLIGKVIGYGGPGPNFNGDRYDPNGPPTGRDSDQGPDDLGQPYH